MTREEAINKVLAIALAEEGYLEKKSNSQLDSKTANAGSNNYTKYWRDIQKSYQGQPYCACFVTWDFVQVFGREVTQTALHHFPYVYCPSGASLAKQYGEWYSTPQKGDIIIFKNTSGVYSHTGLVYAVDNKKVYTIEGNTSGGSTVIANGGGVFKKSYTLGYSRIGGYWRVNYTYIAQKMTEKETPAHWAEPFLNKLIQKGYITDKTSWSNYDSFVSRAQAVALIDKTTGGMWTSNEDDTSVHWSQPHVISLCGKKIIEDKTQWLMGLDTNITKALFLALIDKATGGTKAKYIDRTSDHWGRNNLDSLCDKGIITTPESWTDFESPLTKGLAMGLICKAFIG